MGSHQWVGDPVLGPPSRGCALHALSPQSAPPPKSLRDRLLFKLCISLVLFPFCSQTFPKGLFPQAQPLHFVLFCRLRLCPRRGGCPHGRHRHPEPLHTLLGDA